MTQVGQWVVAKIEGIEYVCVVMEVAGMWIRVRITGSPPDYYGYWLASVGIQPWKGAS